MSARLLVEVLRSPERISGLSDHEWNALISAARAERLTATLAHRIGDRQVPAKIAPILNDAKAEAEREKMQALWEADRAQVALAPLGIPVVLMKGTAYVAAGLSAGQGRFIGDLDILVPRDRLDEAEAALLAAGWEWVKPDPYDDAYYRLWMHELPPLIHRERDRMIDVHHTILPLTARPTPDAEAMLADSVELPGGLRVLSPDDRICHAVAHMFADGDLAGGLRNLWDIKCLLGEMPDRTALTQRARHHGLATHLERAIRLADHFYGKGGAITMTDHLFRARLLFRDAWGRDSAKRLGQAFYIRSHLLRMPPMMLARHLWTKWRRGYRPV
ncbi:MAG: nucleotidyltransferase family protein [Sphingobium sp.]